ncbi:MAG: leucyl aminopeptidase family protein [Jatrophihabitans sp.]|uniref:leucyl aminopeptidase family protein n=1 Tax=Jatrophihabitans sp. TaxID=1932789 RepID=UPI003F7EA22C
MLTVRLVDDDRDATPVEAAGDPAALRVLGGRLARANDDDWVRLAVGPLAGDRLAAFVEGLVLGDYHFSAAAGSGASSRVAELVGPRDAAALADGLRSAAASVWARDLANTPAAVKTPAWLAAQAVRELSPVGVDVQVHDEQWLTEQGFGGLLAVGGGSASPPRFVEAVWKPRRAKAGTHLVLVGKGITFDTGGINRKTGDGMRTMHTDMSGGAAVLAALRAVAQQRVPVRVTALVPIAENSFGGGSFRPGDVIRHVGGRTSEIGNTDAEGRLVLADALAYARTRLRPTAMVDVATLTGAMKVALGLRTAGFFATTDDLAVGLDAAGAAAGEPLWRMPLREDYAGSLRSDIADANNAPGNPGAITAALFLKRFVGTVPWAHLDIAGPARAPEDDGFLARGATGFGARLLARWVEAQA